MELLCIDDDRGVHILLDAAIRELQVGITLHSVGSGEQGLAFLQREGRYVHSPRPATVLLDVNMPRLNGFEVLQAIRKKPGLEAIPVIMFSSSNADADRTRAMELGAANYLVKPDNINGFLEIVIALASGTWFRPLATKI